VQLARRRQCSLGASRSTRNNRLQLCQGHTNRAASGQICRSCGSGGNRSPGRRPPTETGTGSPPPTVAAVASHVVGDWGAYAPAATSRTPQLPQIPGVPCAVAAVLVPEPQSVYDPNAVAVLIEGHRVGYLDRQTAGLRGRAGTEIALPSQCCRTYWSPIRTRSIDTFSSRTWSHASIGAGSCTTLRSTSSMTQAAAREDAVEDLQKRRARAQQKLAAPVSAKGKVAVLPGGDVIPAPVDQTVLSSGGVDIEILVCGRCESRFERLRVRGRKPKFCPTCRTIAS
jgi:hypothetical protein